MAAASVAPVVSLNHIEPGFTFPIEEGTEKILVVPAASSQATQGQGSKSTLDISVSAFDGALSARPNTILLGAMSDRRLRVRKAIPLGVSVEDGHVVVSWNDTNEFACGPSTGDAIDEFSKTIAELFFDLNDQSIPLGKDLTRVRDILNEHIEKVQVR